MQAAFESLDRRRLFTFAAEIDDDVLVATGDGDPQLIELTYVFRVEDDAIAGLDMILLEEASSSFPPNPLVFDADDFDTIRITLGGGDDGYRTTTVYVDADGNVADEPSVPFVVEDLPQRPVVVDFGDGDDSAFASPFRETLIGGPGDDDLQTGGNADSIDAGDGNDTVGVEYAANSFTDRKIVIPAGVVVTLSGGAGDDELSARSDEPDAPAMRVDGGSGRDTITGSRFADSIRGGADGDYVSAGSGDDTIYGDAGNDTLTGGAGRNRVYAGDGNDRLNGSAGRDFLYGEADDDRIYGNAGNDYIDGGGGRDRAWAGDGDDSLIGGSSIDRLFGEAGDDTLVGGPGNDYLFGGDGTDTDRAPDAGDVVDSVETTA